MGNLWALFLFCLCVCLNETRPLVNQTLNVSFPLSARRYSGHPFLAVVSDSLWEKDCGLRWNLGKSHIHVQAPLLKHINL